MESIAVIGLTGRFPGARNVEEFWKNLLDGAETITRFSDQELLAAGVDPVIAKMPGFVNAGSILSDIDQFDALFFGYSARDAESIDPQQRLFLECAWECLESAGYDSGSLSGTDWRLRRLRYEQLSLPGLRQRGSARVGLRRNGR